MDFGRGISIQEDKGLKFQGRWVPVTPAKPIPTRPRTITGGPNWVASSMQLPPEFLQGTPLIPVTNATTHNSTISVDHHMGFNTWNSALSGNKASEPIMNPYTQVVNNVNPNRWNNLPFRDLLALADAASGAPTSAREQNNAAADGRYFPFYIPENNNNQLQSNSAILFTDQNYSVSSNLGNSSNQQQQMLQHGFQVPYRTTYDLNSSPRTMYDLNSTPSTIADVVTNGNLSFLSTPVTPDKGSRMQHNQLSGTCSDGNKSFQFASLAPDKGSKVQHHQTFGSVSPNIASFQFESLTTDQGARMPYNQLLEAVTNGNTSLQFVPPTPDKGGAMQQQQQFPELVNNFQDERRIQERNKLHEDVIPEGGNNIELHSSQESCLENSSPAALEKSIKPTSGSACVALPSEENQQLEKGEENGIDLNKTPQQKPRKKKHRPRVVIEGKPKRTPKSTVKQNNPKETKTVKRKYVRRNTSSTPSTDVVGENNGAKQFASAKTCKRSLNFDSEGQGHESHSKTPRHQEETPQSNLDNNADYLAFENISEPQGTNMCNRNKGSSDTVTFQYSHGLDVMAQNSLADVAFDLNRSAMKMLGDYISLPEITRQPTRRELLRENLKALAGDGHVPRTAIDNQSNSMKYQQELGQSDVVTGNVLRNFEGSISSRLQNSVPLEPEDQHNLISRQNQPLAENKHHNASKRAHSQISEEARVRSYNLIGTHMNSLKVYHEMLRGSEDHRNGVMLFPEIYKKRRTEKNHNMTTASKIHVATLGDEQKEMELHYIKNDSTKMSTLLGNSSQHCAANNTENLRIGANDPTCGYYSLSLPSGDIQAQNIPGAPLSCAEELLPQRTAFDKQKSSELMLTIRQTEMMTGKRSKGHTRVRDFATLTSVTQCNNLQSNVPRNASTSHDKSSIESVQRTGYSMPAPCSNNTADVAINKHRGRSSNGNMVSFSSTNEMRLHGHQAALSGNLHCPANSRGSLEVGQKFNSPVDELVQRLHCLSVTGESNKVSTKEQTALVPFKGDDRMLPFKGDDQMVPFKGDDRMVPFKGDDRMVPYEGRFDAIKKKKARPKVDLDLETDRVWKLLMGKEANDDVEGTNAEKERWWEEERKVFRGRADSFIARMHLIQGDRRFTRWNGSVLDSVIGVFLTQNVSDHLSSSAFMSLAARFPLKPTRDDITLREEVTQVNAEEPEVVVEDSTNTKWHAKMPSEPVVSQDRRGSITIHEAGCVEDKEIGNSSESFESNTGGGCSSGISDKEFGICQVPNTRVGIQKTRLDNARFVEAENGKTIDVESSISSQNSVDSSLFQETVENVTASRESATLLEPDRGALEDVVSSKAADIVSKDGWAIRSCSDSNSEEEDPTIRCRSNGLNGSTSFMELLRTNINFGEEYYNPGYESFSIDLNSKYCYNQLELRDSERLNCDMSKAESDSSSLPSCSKTPIIPWSNPCMQLGPDTGVLNVQCLEQSGLSLSLTAANKEKKDTNNTGRTDPTEEAVGETSCKKSPYAALGAQYSSLDKDPVHPNISFELEACLGKQLHSWSNNQMEVNRTYRLEGHQSTEPEICDAPTQRRNNNEMQQVCSTSPNSSEETLDVVDSTLLLGKKDLMGNTDAESIMKRQVYLSTQETATTSSKPSAKLGREKKTVDWDYLRKEAYQKCGRRERNPDTMDSLDWEAVRCANVNEIANAIKERGMNNMLADRIKDFLNRLVRDHAEIDLEWLRDVPPDKVKEYLLSVRGLGLKSVECVRLLTLHQLAFPVDTNVGRIAVRLGWVPLQPLPESLQLHLLELYPVLETIQKYLWPRLCTLDQQTLYELHYQLITFGKVFCTKSKPNCNACPMRAECKHFASAYASARLALPGPEEKGIVSTTVLPMANQNPVLGISQLSLPPPETDMVSETRTRVDNNEPIIEVPASPEPEYNEMLESDIEDAAFFEDPDEIPTIKLSIEDFAMNLQNYMQENNMELHEGDVSKALVALNPEAASIPTPKLKNVSRLRTEHQVYELPDSHPLLKGLEKRVPGEVSSYLLAIWTPGETADSIQPPEGCCSSQMSGNLCSETTCFSCNNVREANSQTVRGTLLIPCKTAMRGSFPLNGTYFQVNEVFADHDSSLNPIDVPRSWLWNLPRRTVYFGTSIPTIFKGQTTEQIQSCFWRGYVCVRGFDQKSRAPRPLMARLHFPASRLIANKLLAKAKAKRDE